MSTGPVILLGLGYTTRRLALQLRERGIEVIALVRQPERFTGLDLCLHNLTANNIPKQAVLVHTVPPLDPPDDEQIRALIKAIEPRRIVYISATSVYGDQRDVDAATPAIPDDEKSRARLRDEEWLAAGPWDTLILRAAAIYGPGRGIQMAVREGRLPRSGGNGIVSRIHVDDLAALVEAGIVHNLTGAFPVADDLPAPSAEIAVWCAERLELNYSVTTANEFRISGRRVDGSKIRELLGVELRYPTWREGIAASLKEEAA